MPQVPWINPQTNVISPLDGPKPIGDSHTELKSVLMDQIKMKFDQAWIAANSGDDAAIWKEVLLDQLAWEIKNLKEHFNDK